MLCMMEVGTFRSNSYDESWYDKSWDDGWDWYSYQEPLYFVTLKNCLQDLAPRHFWSKFRLVPLLQELFRLCSHHFLHKTSQPSKILTWRKPSARTLPCLTLHFLQPWRWVRSHQVLHVRCNSMAWMHMMTCTPASLTFVCLFHSFILRMNLWCNLLSLSWKNGSWTLFSVDQVGMELNTTFHDRWLANHLVVSTTLDADHWILFDSGALANCCPKNFGGEWQLLPSNGEPPPLRSISGQPLHVYGRRFIRMTLDGVPVCFHFYVCVMFLIRWFLLQSYFCRDTRWTWASLTHVLWEHLMDKKPGLFVMVHFCSYEPFN